MAASVRNPADDMPIRMAYAIHAPMRYDLPALRNAQQIAGKLVFCTSAGREDAEATLSCGNHEVSSVLGTRRAGSSQLSDVAGASAKVRNWRQ